jgi:CheY-like chemotaxis protein
MEMPTDHPMPAGHQVASELNNLLQIIAGTSALLENVWEGRPESEKYFKMLHESVGRAEKIAADLVIAAGGSRDNVEIAPAEPSVPKARDPESTVKPKPRVMVIDDEEMALALYQQILDDAGFEVSIAKSGFQGLDLLRRTPRAYKLVLLDLAMPLMDGEETFERLRAINADLPVVLMTGFVEQEKLTRLKERGLAGFLQKPKRAHEIVAYVRGVIHTIPLAKKRPHVGII